MSVSPRRSSSSTGANIFALLRGRQRLEGNDDGGLNTGSSRDHPQVRPPRTSSNSAPRWLTSDGRDREVIGNLGSVSQARGPDDHRSKRLSGALPHQFRRPGVLNSSSTSHFAGNNPEGRNFTKHRADLFCFSRWENPDVCQDSVYGGCWKIAQEGQRRQCSLEIAHVDGPCQIRGASRPHRRQLPSRGRKGSGHVRLIGCVVTIAGRRIARLWLEISFASIRSSVGRRNRPALGGGCWSYRDRLEDILEFQV